MKRIALFLFVIAGITTTQAKNISKETSTSKRQTVINKLKTSSSNPEGPLMQQIFYLPHCGYAVAVESFTALEGYMQALSADAKCGRQQQLNFV